jgi:hypothetical protein
MRIMIILFLLQASTLFSQECGTQTPSIDFLTSVNPNYKTTTTYNNASLQVKIHIVRKNNGKCNFF